MIRLDLTNNAVAVEGDGASDHLVTVRTLQTAYSSSSVTRTAPTQRELTETARSRSGSQVMREYDIDEPGTYTLVSGRRGIEQNRSFQVRIELLDREIMQISVLPYSFECPWVVDDQIHHHHRTETFSFQTRITHAGVAQAEGEIARIESDEKGVTFKRSTAWERLLEDDESDSV